jgi:hypothetical protein
MRSSSSTKTNNVRFWNRQNRPLTGKAFVPDVAASEPLSENSFALNIAAAMAKRIK